MSLDYPYLSPDQALWLTFSDSKYPCVEEISIVPKILETFIFNFNNKHFWI